MTELELIRKLQGLVPLQRGALVLGIGDDAAIFRPKHSTEDLLITTDLMVEGVHFTSTDRPEFVGYKALARGLSDIAAMGGDPRFCLVSLALPSPKQALPFYRGLLRLAKRTGTLLAGGDLSRSSQFTVDVVVCGSVPKGKALRRDGAKPGDFVYVSAPLGRAAARRYQDRPEPRLSLGRKLRGKASSCMDLSDGLSIDLHRLCVSSKAAATIDYIPVHRSATLDDALHGGEDYELLFTARPNQTLPGTLIGRITQGPPGQVMLDGKPLLPKGHDHFVAG